MMKKASLLWPHSGAYSELALFEQHLVEGIILEKSIKKNVVRSKMKHKQVIKHKDQGTEERRLQTGE